MLDLALAYLDPGSGSLLIQVIIATILAVPYFLRNQIGRALNIVRGRGKREAGSDSVPGDASSSEPS